MARNEQYVPVAPEAIFSVLADPRQYGHVVVGSKEILRWDREWPERGSEFRHKVGFGPFDLSDTTQVVDVDPPHFLELIARARPLGKARVTFEMREADGGTRLSIVEDPLLPGPLHLLVPHFHLLTRLRNRETIRRLADAAAKPPAERERMARERGEEPTSSRAGSP